MCGEEAALSLRRLSGENLLPFILVGDFFDSEKRVYKAASGSGLAFLFPNNLKSAKHKTSFSFSAQKSVSTKSHFEEYNPFQPNTTTPKRLFVPAPVQPRVFNNHDNK